MNMTPTVSTAPTAAPMIAIITTWKNDNTNMIPATSTATPMPTPPATLTSRMKPCFGGA